MRSNLFRKFNVDFKVLFISYLFLFFIPIMSEGQYYEIVYFNIIFNKISLAVVFLALLFSGAIRVISKPICHDAMFLFGLGVIMTIFNASMLFFTQDMNFVVTGFVLMLAPLIYSLNIVQLKKIVVFIIIALTFFLILAMLDVTLNLSLNPLVEIRYYDISERIEGIRHQNNSLFGQKNAFGAIFSVIFLAFLYLESLKLFNQERKWFYLLFISSVILLLSSSSAGGIIVAFFGLLFWIVICFRYRFFIVLAIFLLALWFIFSTNFEAHLDRKLFSAALKLERVYEFFLLISQNPSILLFGFNVFNDVPYYTESTFLDMILNFGILIPIALICFIVYMIVKAYLLKQFLLSFLYFAILFLLLSQNSAFLVPSIISFLIVGSISKKNKNFHDDSYSLPPVSG